MGVPSRERLVLRHAWPHEDFSENTRGSQRANKPSISICLNSDIKNSHCFELNSQLLERDTLFMGWPVLMNGSVGLFSMKLIANNAPETRRTC